MWYILISLQPWFKFLWTTFVLVFAYQRIKLTPKNVEISNYRTLVPFSFYNQGHIKKSFHQCQISFFCGGGGRNIFSRGRRTPPLKKLFWPKDITDKRGRGYAPYEKILYQGQKHTILNFIRGICPLCPTTGYASVFRASISL